MDDATTVVSELGSTPNVTGEETMPVYRGDVSLIPVVFLMASLIIGGNTMTLVAIKRVPSLQTKSNSFVASLAAADLNIGVALIPYGLWLTPGIRELLDRSLHICILLISTASSAILVSILNMTLVALDRLVFIDQPFFYQRAVTGRLIAVLIFLSWVAGLTFGNSQWLIFAPQTFPPQCVVTEVLPEVYYKYAAPWFYFVPCVVIFAIYIKITMVAKKQRKAIAKLTVSHVTPEQYAGQRKTAKLNEKNWKGVKMMMTVFGVFFVAWTPRFLLYAFSGDYLNKHLPAIVFDLALLLGLLNSGVNFLVYPLHNKEFRKVFRQICCPCCLSNSSVYPDNTSMDFTLNDLRDMKQKMKLRISLVINRDLSTNERV
ncbi:hypothetical protein Btru_072158 [Bulinus truncatus]|nr:hypothetical protein Btru_072158 [Bulinus truncatus]